MLDGGIDNKEVLAWYRRLSTAERESFCRVHVSTPIRPAQVSREANLVKRKGFPTPFTKADRPEPPCYFRIKGERRLLKGIRSKGFALLEFLYSAYVGVASMWPCLRSVGKSGAIPGQRGGRSSRIRPKS